MTLLLRLATAAVRAWTRILTCRLTPDVRDARRADVESDLWEGAHDADAEQSRRAWHVLARLLFGVPDDLRWRFEQETTMTKRYGFSLVAALGLGLVAFWMAAAWTHSPAPPLPDVPRPANAVVDYPRPAPPPPPLATVSRDSHVRAEPQRRYAQISYTVGAGMTPPIKIKDARPVYPPIAISYDLRGEVVLDATIDERGRVVETRLVRSIPVLDHPTLNAVRQWEFKPVVVDTVPVRVGITVTARFGM
jgi:TonB family protein